MGASLGQGTGEPDESPGKSGTLPALQAPLRSRARPKITGWRISACEKERSAVSDVGVHGRYPARTAVAGSTLDGGQCGGRCRAPIHLASFEPRSDEVFCSVPLASAHSQESALNIKGKEGIEGLLYGTHARTQWPLKGADGFVRARSSGSSGSPVMRGLAGLSVARPSDKINKSCCNLGPYL